VNVELTSAQLEAATAAGASDAELSQILNLKARAAEFQRAFDQLLSWGAAVEGTELEAEYSKLVGRGFSLRDQVQAATAAIDDALRWARGVFGLDGLQALAGLGIVWFIPLAAIGAAVAALGWWLADYAKFARKFAEQGRIAAELRAAGVDPIEAQRQAAAAVASTVPGWLAPLAGPLGLAALAAVGFLIWQRTR
jgi:hypothetical protein